MVNSDGDQSDNNKSDPTSPYRSPEVRGEKSNVTAIASPNLIRGYSPSIHKNGRTNDQIYENMLTNQGKENGIMPSEFRIKYT